MQDILVARKHFILSITVCSLEMFTYLINKQHVFSINMHKFYLISLFVSADAYSKEVAAYIITSTEINFPTSSKKLVLPVIIFWGMQTALPINIPLKGKLHVEHNMFHMQLACTILLCPRRYHIHIVEKWIAFIIIVFFLQNWKYKQNCNQCINRWFINFKFHTENFCWCIA